MTFHYVDQIAAEVAGQKGAKLYVANQIERLALRREIRLPLSPRMPEVWQME